MKRILQLSVFLLYLGVYAQGIGSEFNPSDLQSINTYNSLNTNSGFVDLDNISGSPYLKDNFQKGKIIENENDQVVTTYLRYNIFEDKFEIKPNLNDDKILALKRSSNYEFVYEGDKVKLVLNSKLFKGKSNGYVFTVLDSQNDGYNLYKIYSQDFTEPKKGKTSYDTDKPGRLDTNTMYYISKDISKGFSELEVNRRKILDAFEPNLKSEMKDYMKSNKYKLRGNDTEVENELINIISHYNTLLNN